MADDAIQFDTRELASRLNELRSRGDQMSELSAKVADMLLVAVEDEFESQGRGEWPGFAYGTYRRSPRRRGGKLLQDTGDLVTSIHQESDAESATVYTNKEYARFHVTGTKNMPQRDFFAIDFDKLGLDITELLLQEIAG